MLILKNKLLKRIKDFKTRETSNLENNKKTLSENQEAGGSNKIEKNKLSTSSGIDSYTDEFNDSIDFLQTLSKQKKIDDEKMKYEKLNQQRKDDLERRTLKNREALLSSSSHNYNNNSIDTPILNNSLVNIDLPEELKESFVIVEPKQFSVANPEKKQDQVPYGILKNGTKPIC